MILRIKLTVVVAALAVFILPIIIVQAQSEGEVAGDVVIEQTEVAAPTVEEGAAVDAEVVAQEEVAAERAEEAVTPAVEEGSVLGAEAAAQEEEAAAEPEVRVAEAPATESAATTTAPSETPIVETAATSTRVEPPVLPVEEPFVLQPAVKLNISGSSIAADISLQNLTCKSCGKVLPAVPVKAYYTAWYPNDGPEYKETGPRIGAQEVNVSDVALWSARAMSWSASDVPSGHYYFVVVVDPENANGAYRMFRSEFRI